MKKIFIMTMVLAVSIGLTGCEPTKAAPPSSKAQSEKARAKSVKNVMEATKTPVLEISLDRENIAKRIARSNDANHIQWMYLFSDTGAVIERFAVRGKVTSGGKRLNSKHGYKRVRGDCGGQHGGCNRDLKVELPDEMGTYGSSAPYIFWFDLDDTLVQTSLKYIVLDKPVNIKGGVLKVSDVDAKELREKRKLEEYFRKGMNYKQAKKAMQGGR